MSDITSIFTAEGGLLIGKIVILFLIAFYGVFSAVIYLHIRSFDKIISSTHSGLSALIRFVFLVHLLLVISLFFLALAIL